MKITIECEDYEIENYVNRYQSSVKINTDNQAMVDNLNSKINDLKDQVRHLQNNNPVLVAHKHASMNQLSSLIEVIASGQKIAAIKLIREITECGLKEAKDLVEGNTNKDAGIEYKENIVRHWQEIARKRE